MPEARHRDAWAEQSTAPSRAEYEIASREQMLPPTRARVVTSTPARSTVNADTDSEDNMLVVVSKLKRYIKLRSDMNTSDGVVTELSNHLRTLCNEAIRNAARDGRKTVLDRDFASLFKRGPG